MKICSHKPALWLTGLISFQLAMLAFASVSARAGDDAQKVIVVVGAPGNDEYRSQFETWAGQWQAAAAAGEAECCLIGVGETDEVSDREVLESMLSKMDPVSGPAVWLVFIGHGTYGGEAPKFNLRGPDLSAAELSTWLGSWRRPLAIVQCASASGPFLAALSGTNRVVITATQSGHEQNFARFGEYIASAIADASADLDKDGQTSLLEAFLVSAQRVAEFYEFEGRLATEHALLDDNGDRLGTPPDWFEGVRAVKQAAAGAVPDGLRAHQFHLVRSERERALPESMRVARDQLEIELEALRARKKEMDPNLYYVRLEELMLRLARLYDAAGQLPDPD